MKRMLLLVAFAALLAAPASARREIFPTHSAVNRQDRVWYWFDDLEPPDPGWTHGDLTATVTPHFHVSPRMAYSGSYSWWCGTVVLSGYGNNWDDRLDIPPITTDVERTSWGAIKAKYRDEPASRDGGRPRGPVYPLLSFAYRNDTEPGYDFTYVDAESAGVFMHLNGGGYDGVHPWSTTGFYLGNMDSPYTCRFRFVSDEIWSDEDGLYNSNSGAFMCDEISIWDYYSGTVYFFDDVESGGLCMPSIPYPAGDHWHIVESPCKAWSDPHVWVNTSVDTPGFVPPYVQNWLMTPPIDLWPAPSCTISFAIQFFTPTVDYDYWTEEITRDGGTTWTQLHVWWGDQCDVGYGPCDHFVATRDVSAFMHPGPTAFRWTYYSTDNGAGPDVCGNAGITLDDIGFYGERPHGRHEGTTIWKRVRSLCK